jgi:DNA-binding response OmpR family regulator
MPRTKSPSHKDNVDLSQSAIHGIRGTLFLLSIVNDEDDAATLRTDLKRSRLNEYKLQRCTSLEQGCSMLRARAFDVLFLDLEELEEPSEAIERIRQSEYKSPIVGLVSRGTLNIPEYKRPVGIDDTLCKEDLSPSLVEHTIRSTLARHALASERSLLETRLNLALEIGEMGSWTYFPQQRRFELDEIAQVMLQSPTGTTARRIDEIVARVYPDDRSQFAEAIERLPLPNEIVKCQFRVNGDSMPLKSFEMLGRVWQPSPDDDAAIIGLFRQTSKTNELFERIDEANTAVQEAFQEREEAIQRPTEHSKRSHLSLAKLKMRHLKASPKRLHRSSNPHQLPRPTRSKKMRRLKT